MSDSCRWSDPGPPASNEIGQECDSSDPGVQHVRQPTTNTKAKQSESPRRCRPCSVMLPLTATRRVVHYLEHVITLERGCHGILACCRAHSGCLRGIRNVVFPLPESDAPEGRDCCASGGESFLKGLKIVHPSVDSFLVSLRVSSFVFVAINPGKALRKGVYWCTFPCASTAMNTLV
jgi:hypothetical protein